MSKYILIAVIVSGFSALADSALSIKSFTVTNGRATLSVKADGVDVALTGPMNQSPQLQGQNGRLIANCATIGSKTLECEVGYDGGTGQLAIFKQTDASKYSLANTNVVLTDGPSFEDLVKFQNDRSLSAEATTDSVIRAAAKADSIDKVIATLQAEPVAPQALPSDAVLRPAGPPPGRPPVVVAPPIEYDGQPGTHGIHSRHEEHHSNDSVVDTYDNESSYPIIQETQRTVTCVDGRCFSSGGPGPIGGPCGTCGLPPPGPCPGLCGVAQLPVNPYGPPVVVGPPPGPGIPTPYPYGGGQTYAGQPYYPQQPPPYYQQGYYPSSGPVVVDRYSYRGPVRTGYQGQPVPGGAPMPQPYQGPAEPQR